MQFSRKTIEDFPELKTFLFSFYLQNPETFSHGVLLDTTNNPDMTQQPVVLMTKY